MKHAELLQKMKELEERIRTLESRPIYYPVVIPQYVPASPSVPWNPVWCSPTITYTSRTTTEQ